ncbi:hypothetical protein NQ314_002362 [Rhamnusium bicolor]|uniref:EGF-like domain-containing protein n=1 Tax=Rhamnusium bicolor TaxID=1586634 RepID=A0AAV8ZRT2_9CUCU|nr:hypothetical protein NQ314_002362 [Rhamnusium bicolor]
MNPKQPLYHPLTLTAISYCIRYCFTNNLLTKACVHFILTGVDYCAKGHNCHANATCLNLQTTYACQCDQGFQGDGRVCTGMIFSFINN